MAIRYFAAEAFCEWRTQQLNEYREQNGLSKVTRFRLLTAQEWEVAAQARKDLVTFAWGCPYVRNGQGNLMANLKSGVGTYGEYGDIGPCPVDFFGANEYGIYIDGNTYDWTCTRYSAGDRVSSNDLNPVNGKKGDKRVAVVIKGGSYASCARLLRIGEMVVEHVDKPRAIIGFRCGMSVALPVVY